MRIIIAGSRNYTNLDEFMLAMGGIVARHPDLFIENIEVVSGGARGVDSMGEYWANLLGYKIIRFIPSWDRFGRAAGHIRNAEMAEYADVLIAFWDGVSKGTESMINLAKKKGLKVIIEMI